MPTSPPRDATSLGVPNATRAARALGQRERIEVLERRAARLFAVANVQRAITAAVALDELAAEIYGAVASVVDAPCFTLLLFDDAERVFVPMFVVNDGVSVATQALPRMPLGEGATSQAFRSGTPNITARSSQGWTGRAHELAGSDQIAVMLSAPIIDGERTLGVLQAQSYRSDAYDWEDVDLVMHVARQAGTALARARTFEAERRAREEAEAAFSIARIALGGKRTDDALAEMRLLLDQVAPGAAVSLSAGDDRAAPGGAIPLVARDQAIGTIGLAAGVTPATRALLERLATPLALALDALAMRDEELRKRHREHLLAAALETLEQPVFICTGRATIRYANGAASREYGYPAERLIGLRARELSAHTVGQTEAAGVHQAMIDTGHWSGELVQRRADGGEFPAHVEMNEIRESGTPIGIVVSVRNLTEDRRIAEQLRQSDKLAALGDIVAGVAHEVNNPLAGISAFAQLLQEAPLTPDQYEAVQIIKRESDRASAVVRDLLVFSRKTGPRSVQVDLATLLDQTLRLRSYSLRMAGVQIERAFPSELPRVYGDDRQLQQVFLNLIVNAEHAMANLERRVLTVRAFPDTDHVIVEVGDTGTGIAQDLQQRIFEPFFTTKGEGKGTGLGLSVSYGIIQSHGGTITVQSAPGAGATFRIALPLDRRRTTREPA